MYSVAGHGLLSCTHLSWRHACSGRMSLIWGSIKRQVVLTHTHKLQHSLSPALVIWAWRLQVHAKSYARATATRDLPCPLHHRPNALPASHAAATIATGLPPLDG